MKIFIYVFILLQLLIVSFIDFKHKIISNWWHVFNLCAFVLFVSIGLLEFDWRISYFSIGFIIFGFILFNFKFMGAGDSKYLAFLFLLIPYQFHWLFFDYLLVSTIAVGSILLLIRIIKNFSKIYAFFLSRFWTALRDIIKSEFSYAPVILLAWVLLGIKLWLN